MEDKFEIGDIFVIRDPYKKRKYYYSCKNPNKEFSIKRITQSRLSVYYDDLRTNNSCKCHNCDQNKIERCISVNCIYIVETKKERQRHLKLKKLGL